MSEVYTTLGSSTLASNYTAGDGVLSLVDASSFPSTGRFSVIVDPGPTGANLIFTVNGVSGDDLDPVVVEFNSDTSITAGAVVVEVQTQRSFDALFQQQWWGAAKKLVRPVAANFATQNPGTSTYYSDANSLSIVSQVSGGDAMRAWLEPIPSPGATGVLVEAMVELWIPSANYFRAGLAIRESSSGRSRLFGIRYDNSIMMAVEGWSSDGSYGFSSPATMTIWSHPHPLWLRIRIEGSTIYFEYSTSGTFWALFYSEAKTTWFSAGPTHWGINICNNNGLQCVMSLFHWNPISY